jgi:hypothetical protein
VLADGLGELSFCVCHCRLFRIILPIRRNKVTKNYTNLKKLCNFAPTNTQNG